MPERSYSDEQEAAKALLQDVVERLHRNGVGFLVVGGWVPFLFHSQKRRHPGTFDADVLVHNDALVDGTFERATNEMLDSNDYLRAVKNRFQAHRIMHVRNERLVFHADFLNARSNNEGVDVVVGTGRMRSVHTPLLDLAFKYGPTRTHPEFPGARFPSVETFIASKAAATRVAKRTRDAFDIFVSIEDDPILRRDSWRQLRARDGGFAAAHEQLLESVVSGDAIQKVCHHLGDASAHLQVRAVFETFLS